MILKKKWTPGAHLLLKCYLKGKISRKLANGQNIDYSEKKRKWPKGFICPCTGVKYHNIQICLLVYEADFRRAFTGPLVLWSLFCPARALRYPGIYHNNLQDLELSFTEFAYTVQKCRKCAKVCRLGHISITSRQDIAYYVFI